MPLFHCNSCHHEWEGTKDMDMCDWCKSDSHILEEETSFEKFMRNDGVNKILKEFEKEKK